MNYRRRTFPPLEAVREKVTVSLHAESLGYADRKAHERGISRSEVIDAALAEAEEREIGALMIAGYKAMAHENAELAEEGMESFWEAIKDEPNWPNFSEETHAAR